MELRYLTGNPAFPFEDKEGDVRAVWEMTLARGETVVPHAHPDGVELYVVLDGIGEIKVGADSNTMFAGDVVYIPRGVSHSASNTMEQPLHVVGLLWEPNGRKLADASSTASSPGSVDAATAIGSILRLATFAEGVKKKLRSSADIAPAEREQRVRELEAAIMKSIGRVWSEYSGRM